MTTWSELADRYNRSAKETDAARDAIVVAAPKLIRKLLRNMTLSELAGLAGVAQSTLSVVRNGNRPCPGWVYAELAKVADNDGVPM